MLARLKISAIREARDLAPLVARLVDSNARNAVLPKRIVKPCDGMESWSRRQTESRDSATVTGSPSAAVENGMAPLALGKAMLFRL